MKTKYTKGSALGLLLAVLCLVVTAQAQTHKPKGGGSPGPHFDEHTKVELADGEEYILAGQVSMDLKYARYFFNVDLSVEPWLANARRIDNPFYELLKTDNIQWGKYLNKTIVIKCKAIAGFSRDQKTGKTTYQPVLQLLAKPKVMAARRSGSSRD